MKWKKSFYRLAVRILLLFVLLFYLCDKKVWAQELPLPPLIQATTLEGDYRAITSLGLAGTPLLLKEDLQQAFDNILCSCVRIQAKGHYGSGSIFKMLEDEIIIVTNRHVLQYWNEDSYVTFFNGSPGFARILGVSNEADVGFLAVYAGNFSYEELLTFRNIRLLQERAGENGEEAALAEGNKCLLVDMATSSLHPVRKEGEILSPLAWVDDFKMEMLLAQGEAMPGMSGSGVFDGYGNYLGMVTGGTVYGEVAVTPAKVICEEYEVIVNGISFSGGRKLSPGTKNTLYALDLKIWKQHNRGMGIWTGRKQASQRAIIA